MHTVSRIIDDTLGAVLMSFNQTKARCTHHSFKYFTMLCTFSLLSQLLYEIQQRKPHEEDIPSGYALEPA